MDLIYKHAALTILAVAEPMSSNSLLGMGSQARPGLEKKHVLRLGAHDLSMSSDSLAAVETILNRFAAESFPIHHLYGVPTHAKSTVSGTHRGLMWSHGAENRALERRAEFPMWSWAGGGGAVRWLEDDWDGLDADAKNTGIYIADE
ncbi:hypothetical protein AK830_g4343 [Neonectria ditissima]|uniref:Uncharacterized protein n=1 Tax=Neonectria ditissima TaxID=78410 RepID=A0A0P7B8X4_9HYPO|nr:hypothetical protein AK830_g4343 [Neonectria ditissima]